MPSLLVVVCTLFAGDPTAGWVLSCAPSPEDIAAFAPAHPGVRAIAPAPKGVPAAAPIAGGVEAVEGVQAVVAGVGERVPVHVITTRAAMIGAADCALEMAQG